MRVVIAGGGVAAIEAFLGLQALADGPRLDITVLSPEPGFVYRPVTVAEAFGRGEARTYDLADIVRDEWAGRLISDALREVCPDERVAVTGSGERIPYDALVVATGATPSEPLAGALTFRGRPDVAALRGLLDDLVTGRAGSVALALPAQGMWPLPLYELALMTAAHLREHGADSVRVRLVTPEEEPLELFGSEGTRAVTSMLEARGVELRTSSLPARVEGRRLALAGGAWISADAVITLPLLGGPRLPGLPWDRRGFIPVDGHGRVVGVHDVYAAGDVTSFPLKQGGLAAQQADAVAESIAADAGVQLTPERFQPVLRGLLLTGGSPLYLRCEPQSLPRRATVAIEARPSHLQGRDESAAAGQPLWWPPAKIAARYLAPYLAAAVPAPVASELLADRSAAPGRTTRDSEYEDALGLALLLADCDARWGDHRSAISALDAAEALEGALPAEYEAKRREWRAAALADQR